MTEKDFINLYRESPEADTAVLFSSACPPDTHWRSYTHRTAFSGPLDKATLEGWLQILRDQWGDDAPIVLLAPDPLILPEGSFGLPSVEIVRCWGYIYFFAANPYGLFAIRMNKF